MYDVITIGSATRDTFFITRNGDVLSDPEDTHRTLIAFEFGAKINIEDLYITDGGGGCNSATAFARLGLKTKTLMQVGKDELGEVIKNELFKENADISGINVDENLVTGISAIIIDKESGERTVLFYPGANLNLDIKDPSVLNNTRWLYIAPLSSQKPADCLPVICDYADKKGIKIAFNPSIKQIEKGYESMKEILKCATVLIVNNSEAQGLVSSYLGKDAELPPEELLKHLSKTGPQIVVITLSSDGSMAYENGKSHRQKSVKTKAVDTTGAGDSFGSTFISGLMFGYPVDKSLKFAAINSSSVISRYGAQEGLLTLPQIENIFNKTA